MLANKPLSSPERVTLSLTFKIMSPASKLVAVAVRSLPPLVISKVSASIVTELAFPSPWVEEDMSALSLIFI